MNKSIGRIKKQVTVYEQILRENQRNNKIKFEMMEQQQVKERAVFRRKMEESRKQKEEELLAMKKLHEEELHTKNEEVQEDLEEAKEGLVCIVCWDQKRAVLCQPCNHLNMCETCAQNVQEQQQELICPTCRAPITELVKVFIP